MLKERCYILNKKNSDKLNLHKKQDNSKLLFKTDFEKFDFDFKNMLGWIYYPNYCFATIIDNKIVSCASAGYHADKINDKIIEISTITHKDYRGKGYAVSNVVALCEYVLNMQEKREIHYTTDINNIASQKTALSAGLIKIPYGCILLKKLKLKFG
jgi:RimJ/RimL family protein N-acetyltransferase